MDERDIICYFVLILCVITLSGIALYEYNRINYEYSLPYIQERFIEGDYATWDKDVVTIGVLGDCPNWEELQDVLNEWNEVMPDNVPRLSYSEINPDITIVWKPYVNENWAGGTWWTLDGDGDTILNSDIAIRTSWSFNREHVIRHELGHAMGLSYHSNHPNSTMYKYANGANMWSDEDIAMAESIYNSK